MRWVSFTKFGAAPERRTSMPSIEPIDELMLRWEESRQKGEFLSAEQLCADVPQLKEELRQRIHIVCDMENLLGVGKHDPHLTLPAQDHFASTEHSLDSLPIIPGYEVLREIDRGGMGVVYEARHLELGRTVAIKMILAGPSSRKSLARFRLEAEAAARLLHPNFVQIFDMGQVNGRPFFSMEFVTGGNLADLLKRRPIAARQAAELTETLARAVYVAHLHDIVHRDLKPNNVLLTPDGTPKIADFGLAKRLDDDSQHTHTGEIMGTPNYMAPEQASGSKGEIGPKTDVYALGAILYEMLVGKPPFQGDSPIESLRLVLNEDPVAPSRRASNVPRDLEVICLKCLEKSPSQRYDSALALADDLRRFLNGQHILAKPIGRLRRCWKWVRRHPQQATFAGLLALLAMAPFYTLIQNYRTERQVHARAVEQAPQVREILERNCFACHGGDVRIRQKNFNIVNHQQLLDGGRRLVVAGSPESSRLIQRIADGSMPPEEDEIDLPRLSEKELVILTDWIKGGAPPLPPVNPDRLVAPVEPYSEVAAQTKAIFQKHCYDCHKFNEAKGGIKILHHRLLVSVRKVVLPGHPDQSELFELLNTDDDERRMPPPPANRLADDEIATIRRWIEQGAPPFPKTELK